MAKLFHNPFAGIHLWTPNTQRDIYDQYCQTVGSNTGIDQKPFPRKVDFWFAGLSVAAWKGLQPMEDIGKTSNFIEGSIFNSDSWRVHAVMLIAIAIENDVAVVENPSRMMGIANRLAAAGAPHIVNMLTEGNHPPIWNLSDAFDKLLHPDTYIAEQPNSTRLSGELKGG